MSPAKSNRGRPIVHTEPWAKITVVLLDRHVAYLDRLAIDIRLKHGKAISRAEIIRGLIEASFQSGIDLSQADSIDQIVELLTIEEKSRSLGRGARRRAVDDFPRSRPAARRAMSSSLQASVRSMPLCSTRSRIVRIRCGRPNDAGMSGFISRAICPR